MQSIYELLSTLSLLLSYHSLLTSTTSRTKAMAEYESKENKVNLFARKRLSQSQMSGKVICFLEPSG